MDTDDRVEIPSHLMLRVLLYVACILAYIVTVPLWAAAPFLWRAGTNTAGVAFSETMTAICAYAAGRELVRVGKLVKGYMRARGKNS